MKAPSNKLFPFVKLLLAENSLLQSSAAAAEPNGVKVCSPSHMMLSLVSLQRAPFERSWLLSPTMDRVTASPDIPT